MIVADGLAALSNRLDLLAAFSGALTTSLLGVVIPSVMELLIEGNNSKWLSIKNYLLISVGVFAFLLGTSISVLELYQSIKTTA